MKFVIAIAFVLLCFIQIEKSPGQEPEILKKVLALEGEWAAKMSGQLVDSSYTFDYYMNFRKAAGGHTLTMEEIADIPGVGTLQGGNLIGYDVLDGKLHWLTVDNLSTTHDHIAELLEKDHLRLVHESKRNEKPFREEIDFQWKSNNEVWMKLTGMLDGRVEELLEGRFLRTSRE